jgi:DNA-dependent RNA polymerase auxiliary subunit epsilon
LQERKQLAVGNDIEIAWLDRLGRAIADARADQVYICCFCQKEDLLSQWRGYADNGGGVSIEFDPAGFSAYTGGDCQHGLMRLWKVFYDREQQRSIVRDCLDSLLWPTDPEARIRHVVDALQFFIPTFKSAAFSGEEERRLIFTPYPQAAPKPHFRTHRSLIVPYYSFQELCSSAGERSSAFRLPLQNLLIGPGDRRQLNAESARLLLDSKDYATVPVRASSMALRF